MKSHVQLVFFTLTTLILISLNCGILGGSSTVSSQNEPTPNYIEYFELGKSYYSNGNLEEAIPALQQSIIQNPDFAPAAELLGLAFIDQNEFEAAIYQFSGVLRQNGYSINSRLGQGRIYILRNEYELALNEYAVVLEVDPNNAESHFYRGVALRKLDYTFLSYTSFAKAILNDETYRTTVEGLIPLSEPHISNLFKIEYLAIEGKAAITRADAAALLVSIIREKTVYQNINSNAGFQPPQLVDNEGQDIMITDVSDNYWARFEIYTVVGSGLFEVSPDHSFSPEIQMNKGDFAQLLQFVFARILNDPGLSTRYFGQESPFNDINSAHWAYNAARLIMEHDLMPLDQPDIFGLNESVTGLQAIYALEKARMILIPGQ